MINTVYPEDKINRIHSHTDQADFMYNKESSLVLLHIMHAWGRAISSLVVITLTALAERVSIM